MITSKLSLKPQLTQLEKDKKEKKAKYNTHIIHIQKKKKKYFWCWQKHEFHVSGRLMYTRFGQVYSSPMESFEITHM